MLRKNLICSGLFFCFAICISNAQNSELKVTYKIESLKNVDDMEGTEAKKMLSSANAALVNFEFELLLNKNESLFKKTKQLKTDEFPDYIYNIALALCDGDKIWYNNKSSKAKTAVTVEAGEPLALTLEEDLIWEITKESKKIGDWQAYKANTFRIEGKRKVPVTAWFSNDLPYNFGPLGFDGLPGLILELQIEDVIFILKSLEKESTKIKQPTKTRTMAYQEYYLKLEIEMGEIIDRGY